MSNTIIEIIEQESLFSFEQLLQQNRKKKIKIARQILHYYLCMEAFMSLKKVGKLTQRDHSTVLHNRDLVAQMVVNKDPMYLPLFDKVKKRIAKSK